ncbi:hypothetical protein L6R53_22085 [Myxococcota bacterium]|nr:hypothetical protein [Myxococcota bacterium]
MPRLLQYTRVTLGALTIGAAAPLAAMQWADLAAERDALRQEVQRLQAQGAMDTGAAPERPAQATVSYGGSALGEGAWTDLAEAEEQRVQLATEAASLRRELARTRAELQGWERAEGSLDLVVESRGATTGAPAPETLDLLEQTRQLRGRLSLADRDLDEVQVERDEALAQLRREMFNNLVYSAIIGECGHRLTPRAVDACSAEVRARLSPHWSLFESCVRNTNAIPAYSQAGSAQNVSRVIRLERGAVLLCDPGLPEGGAR